MRKKKVIQWITFFIFVHNIKQVFKISVEVLVSCLEVG